jgi:hypothetical protein
MRQLRKNGVGRDHPKNTLDVGKNRGPKGKKRVRDDSDKENDSGGPRVMFCSASMISSDEESD